MHIDCMRDLDRQNPTLPTRQPLYVGVALLHPPSTHLLTWAKDSPQFWAIDRLLNSKQRESRDGFLPVG